MNAPERIHFTRRQRFEAGKLEKRLCRLVGEAGADYQIGRGSWRGRGEISGGAGSFKKKKKEEWRARVKIREVGVKSKKKNGVQAKREVNADKREILKQTQQKRGTLLTGMRTAQSTEHE